MGQGIGLTTEMANKINEMDPSKMDVIQQKIHNVTETLGNGLSPTVMDILNSSEKVIGRVATWAENNQQLAGTVMKIILLFGILVSAGGFLAISFGSIGFLVAKIISVFKLLGGGIVAIKSGFTTLQILALYAGDGLAKFGGFGLKAFGVVKSLGLGIFNFGKQAIFAGAKAMPGLISSVWSFTTALLANPVTWIVVGVIALIAALYLLYKNWDKVAQFLNGAWSGTVTKVTEIWTNVSTSFTNAVTNFLPKVKESGAKILTTLTDGIRSVINKPAELVKEGLGKIRNMLPFSDAKVGPLSKLTLSGKRIFETITVGMNATKSMPHQMFANAMNFGKDFFSGSDSGSSSDAGAKKPGSILQVIRETARSESSKTTDKTTTQNKGKKIIIQKVELHFDIKDLKDISLMKKLLEEVEEIDNSISDEPDDDLVMA